VIKVNKASEAILLNTDFPFLMAITHLLYCIDKVIY
jgi:hypothetical protein